MAAIMSATAASVDGVRTIKLPNAKFAQIVQKGFQKGENFNWFGNNSPVKRLLK